MEPYQEDKGRARPAGLSLGSYEILLSLLDFPLLDPPCAVAIETMPPHKAGQTASGLRRPCRVDSRYSITHHRVPVELGKSDTDSAGDAQGALGLGSAACGGLLSPGGKEFL